ncbi:hypothetical protein [Hathewaya massiliensis]|uniref:hypothetical protein n=1 Tax=Hathewaya massiliensis TaxID=1964382 RepID=UPI0011576DDD|nr:hypothetical protein [Hathewaya massiliensis]
MAYRATAPVLTEQQSIAVILESEVSIIQCMADLFCNELVADILAIPANTSAPTVEELQRVSQVLKNIMCGYTIKENSIAEVIKALAKKQAADMGINPCELKCKHHKDEKCC